MDAATTFRVLIPGHAVAADVLGLWQPAPGDEPATVWEVDVVGDAALATTVLQEPAARLATAVRALPAVESRLQSFMNASHSQQGPLAYAAAGTGPGEAERRLALVMAPEGQAFVLGGLRSEVDEALRRALDFSNQVRLTLGQPALVKSSAGGRPLGYTRVGWSGDVRTCWGTGLSRAAVVIHEQAVRLALATFHSWLRIVTLVAAGAVQLSLLLPSGIGALAALPAAWNFITDILAESQRLRQQPA
jgi:hypothetical protein